MTSRPGSRTRKALAPATIGVLHSIVSTVMKAAIRDRRIHANPCEGTRLPKVNRVTVVPLTTGQVNAVEAAMPERLKALVSFAAGTAMRQGEVLGLTVDRLHMLQREVVVDRQLVTLAKREPFLGPPKTQASVRTIPLPNSVVSVMAEHLALFPPGPDGFVSRSTTGSPSLAKLSGGNGDRSPRQPDSPQAQACTPFATTTRPC